MENCIVDEIVWENVILPVRPQTTIWGMSIACWIPKACKHTLRIWNTYCFSKATMVARTRLNVTLYVICLF